MWINGSERCQRKCFWPIWGYSSGIWRRRQVSRETWSMSRILELSWRVNSMKSSRAISPVRCLYWTDVSRTIRTQMMMTEMVLETSVSYRHLTGLIVREDFIEWNMAFGISCPPIRHWINGTSWIQSRSANQCQWYMASVCLSRVILSDDLVIMTPYLLFKSLILGVEISWQKST
jgi:hypothetical protein